MTYSDSDGKTWDLDDPATDSWFPSKYLMYNADGLRQEIYNKIGYSLCYMMCLHPILEKDAQYDRVLKFGRRFAKESHLKIRYDDTAWLRKQLFLILDETENQC